MPIPLRRLPSPAFTIVLRQMTFKAIVNLSLTSQEMLEKIAAVKLKAPLLSWGFMGTEFHVSIVSDDSSLTLTVPLYYSPLGLAFVREEGKRLRECTLVPLLPPGGTHLEILEEATMFLLKLFCPSEYSFMSTDSDVNINSFVLKYTKTFEAIMGGVVTGDHMRLINIDTKTKFLEIEEAPDFEYTGELDIESLKCSGSWVTLKQILDSKCSSIHLKRTSLTRSDCAVIEEAWTQGKLKNLKRIMMIRQDNFRDTDSTPKVVTNSLGMTADIFICPLFFILRHPSNGLPEIAGIRLA